MGTGYFSHIENQRKRRANLTFEQREEINAKARRQYEKKVK